MINNALALSARYFFDAAPPKKVFALKYTHNII